MNPICLDRGSEGADRTAQLEAALIFSHSGRVPVWKQFGNTYELVVKLSNRDSAPGAW